MRVIVALLAWSLAEIAGFVVVGGWIGLVGVLALVLGTGVAGVVLLRRQGLELAGAMRGPRALQAAGKAGIVALAAVMLILPGFLTDVVGLVLLVPAVQRLVLAWIGVRAVVRHRQGAAGDIVEATAQEVATGALPPSGWTRE